MDGLVPAEEPIQDSARAEAAPAPPARSGEERLPFSVRLVGTEDDLRCAVSIRQSAYARHVPDLAQRLNTPEPYDYDADSVVLLALSKLDSQPIGTMRIQTNRHRRLPLQDAVELPDWLDGQTLAQASRLGIALGRVGRLVKTALFKSYYEYCAQSAVDWMVIAARSPLDRQYEALLFQDLEAHGRFVPLSHVGNIPHRLMALEVASVEPRWRAAAHPLYDYFFKTLHPDIDPLDRRLRTPARAASLAAAALVEQDAATHPFG